MLGPLNKTEFHLPKKAEIGTLVKEKVLNYILCFSYLIVSRFEKKRTLHLNSLNCTNIYFCCVLSEKTMAQLESPSFKHALRLTKLELAKASEEKNMKCHQCFLYYFTITCISSWKRP